VVGLIPAALALAGLWLPNAIATIVSFASAGIYIAFQMLVLAALVARLKGWQPSGRFTLGVWALPVNVAALLYGISAIVDMVWPRAPEDPWYSNYGMIVGTVAIVLSGLIYMVLGRPYDRGNAPFGDAHLLRNNPASTSSTAAPTGSRA
jgi:amino acid transporter